MPIVKHGYRHGGGASHKRISMVQINFAQREVQCKVVYYGPAQSGKTENLSSVRERMPKKICGALTTIATDAKRTLFFDFLPLNLGKVANINAKVHLYGVPWQENQTAVRLLVLEGVDGIVFVADRAGDRQQANLQALEDLRQNLANMDRRLEEIPIVFQWNKSDLPDALSEEELRRSLNPEGHPEFAATATSGEGVIPTVKAITQLVLENVSRYPRADGQSASKEPAAVAQSDRVEPSEAKNTTRDERVPLGAGAPAADADPISVGSESGGLSLNPRAPAASAEKPESSSEPEEPMIPRWRTGDPDTATKPVVPGVHAVSEPSTDTTPNLVPVASSNFKAPPQKPIPRRHPRLERPRGERHKTPVLAKSPEAPTRPAPAFDSHKTDTAAREARQDRRDAQAVGDSHWMDTASHVDEWMPPERHSGRDRAHARPTIEEKKASAVPAANLLAGGVFLLVSLAAFVYVLLKLL